MADEIPEGGDLISPAGKMPEGQKARLTPKMRAFCEEYLRDWNGTRAAERAGFRGTDNALGAKASALLKRPEVKAYLAERVAEQAMETDEVLSRFAEQARASIGDFVDYVEVQTFDKHGNNTGSYMDIRPKMDEIRKRGHLVKKISSGPKGWSLELYSGQEALYRIGQHLGLFKDEPANVEVNIFDIESWKRQRAERLKAVEDLEEPECGTPNA